MLRSCSLAGTLVMHISVLAVFWSTDASWVSADDPDMG